MARKRKPYVPYRPITFVSGTHTSCRFQCPPQTNRTTLFGPSVSASLRRMTQLCGGAACGVAVCGAGALICGVARGAGVTVRGVEAGGAPIAGAAGAVCMVVVIAPRCFTVSEIFPRLRMLPRGIPSPAESLRTVIRFWDTPSAGFVPRPTNTVLWSGVVGGCGWVKRGGGLTTRGVPFHPPQEPGVLGCCHIQP